MRHVVWCMGAVGMLLCRAGWVLADPVVTNGDFEAVQIGPPFVSHNLADVPGWNHTGTLGDGPLWHVGYADGDGSVTVAGHGNQFVTLGGGFGPIGSASWDQLVPGFTPGKTYTLTFDMASEANFSGPQTLNVDFPSGSSTPGTLFLAGPTPANYWRDWETKTMNFVATDTSVDIRFSVTDKPFDVGLDDVRVTPAAPAVPEPSSFILLGLSGLGLAGYAWRRRQRAA